MASLADRPTESATTNKAGAGAGAAAEGPADRTGAAQANTATTTRKRRLIAADGNPLAPAGRRPDGDAPGSQMPPQCGGVPNEHRLFERSESAPNRRR